MSVAIISFGALSALGEGWDAATAGSIGQSPRSALARDPILERAGFLRPFAGRCAYVAPAGDRSHVGLGRALDACIAGVEHALPNWRDLRIGVCLGTSTGGMEAAERWFADENNVPADATSCTYFGPVWIALRDRLPNVSPATVVLGACASSTLAIGVGLRWLEQGACDLVYAGGFDAIAEFVAAGFEVLKATSASVPPRPFRQGRDGMALGEGAAVVALTDADRCAKPLAYVNGFGASSDAVHLTAPDREGKGLARAIEASLLDAKVSAEAIDVVSAHATATPFNDAAESKVFARLFGAKQPVVQPFKAQVGHTLGAAGALETLAAIDALKRGILPGAVGEGAFDPEAAVRTLAVAEQASIETALKVSCAFGGSNAALVVSRNAQNDGKQAVSSRETKVAGQVYLSHAVHLEEPIAFAELASLIDWPLDRVTRVDTIAHLALSAAAKLNALVPLAGAGIIVGESFATIETNRAYCARIREKSVRAAEPRKFPYTSPNAAGGECSVAFQLTGPSFAVGGGLHAGVEALAVALTLLEAGDATTMVVIAVDECGGAVNQLTRHSPFRETAYRSGAVALLLTTDPTRTARARVLSVETGFTLGLDECVGPVGHLALEPLVREVPEKIESRSPPGAWARANFGPVSVGKRQ